MITPASNTIEGLFISQPQVFSDNRGCFFESFNLRDWQAAGLDIGFVQDNQSISAKGVLRGMHYQKKYPQAKLIRVVRGRIFDVCVDLRPGSKSFGAVFSIELSEANCRQLFIPAGFAHGFLSLEDNTHVCYKCDDFYHPDDEGGILWNDPELSIPWPGIECSGGKYFLQDGTPLTLSAKDEKLPSFSSFLNSSAK